MKYLKLFKTTAEYEAYIADSENFVRPNVSLCEDDNSMYFYDFISDIDSSKEYFTIEALEDGLTVKLSRNASQYRIDNSEWVTLESNTETPSINNGQKISFKITNPTISTSYPYGIGTFTVSKSFNIEGNIMSLLYGDDFEGQTDLSGKDRAFYRLFYNCTTLQSAENLILPATTLVKNCYNGMFQGCTSLTTAPELPATTLASYCYDSMFEGCTSLTEAPELPVTTLAIYCYNRMFAGCTSLTTVPELPATTLEQECYAYMFYKCTSLTTAPELPATTLEYSCYAAMFQGCTSLTTAPELPATTLASYCYNGMFQGCSKLNYIKMLATDISANYCLTNWVSVVAENGTFVKNVAMTSLPSGISGVPNGWTVQDYYYFPSITNMLSTPIDFNYNEGMFTPTVTVELTKIMSEENILSLQPMCDITVNVINKDNTLHTSDYLWINTKTLSDVMKELNIGDVNNIAIAIIDADIPEDGGYYYYTIEENPYSQEYFTIEALGNGTVSIGIPSDATSLKYRKNDEAWIETSEAIQVSVMTNDTIQISCNSYSFNGDCSSPFNISTSFNVKGNIMSLLYGDNFEGQTDLSYMSSAFQSLFSHCTTLQSAENLVLPATTLEYKCYQCMFWDCTSLQVAPALPATTLANWCYWGMFNGCSKLNYIKMLATDISASDCLYNWVDGVTSSGTFVKNTAMTSLPSGISGIPEGWTVENA